MIVVFLNNKLVTADTIVPFMLEVKKARPDREMLFLCADEKTFQILNRNIVLLNCIQHIGQIHNLGSPNRTVVGRTIGVLRKLRTLLILTFRLVIGERTHFIHFRALNEAPFSILAKFNLHRTCLMEPTCWGHSKTMIEIVGNQNGARRWSSQPARCGTMIAFSEDWPQLHHPAHVSTRKLLIESTHLAPAWIEYVSSNSDRYFHDILKSAGYSADTRVIVYILGTLGPLGFLRDASTMPKLLDDTLSVLEEYSFHMPVILKPHAITDEALLREALARRTRGHFVVADIHPMVLATRAVAFIGNYISLSFGDARALSVPTIEYTDYSDASLSLTRNRSMRDDLVTHFISGDPTRFRQVLSEIVLNPPPSRIFPRPSAGLRQAIMLFDE